MVTPTKSFQELYTIKKTMSIAKRLPEAEVSLAKVNAIFIFVYLVKADFILID